MPCSSLLSSLVLLLPKGRASRDHSNPTSQRRAREGKTKARQSRAKARALKRGRRRVLRQVRISCSRPLAHGLGDRLRAVLASAEAGQSLKSGTKKKTRLASGKQSFYAACPPKAPKTTEQARARAVIARVSFRPKPPGSSTNRPRPSRLARQGGECRSRSHCRDRPWLSRAPKKQPSCATSPG